MKFQTIAALVGLATAVDVGQANTAEETAADDALVQQEAAALAETCQDYDQYDEAALLGLDAEEGEGEALDEDKRRKHARLRIFKGKKGAKVAHRDTYKAHFGKSKAAIDAENKHILGTMSKCLHFVKNHGGHSAAICGWCKHRKPPTIRWKWLDAEHVWYRWYDGHWHYWGPSKDGFTAEGWTWYSGYWHHGGYVFKYYHHKWYRFQGGKWVFYHETVPINPKIPREKKICRPFFILRKYGFPTSLAARKLPRCKVGSGKSAAIYQWKGDGACRFLGGKKVYTKSKICKEGKPHTWERVIRCVRGPVISGKGFNYKTGGAHVEEKKKKTVTRKKSRVHYQFGAGHGHTTTRTVVTHVVAGMTVG